MLVLRDVNTIYYINPLNEQAYTTDNLPITDTVKSHVEGTFLRMTRQRNDAIERGYFIYLLTQLGDNFPKCEHYNFKYHLNRFKEITGGTDEQIKGFLRYQNTHKISRLTSRREFPPGVMEKICWLFYIWMKNADAAEGCYSIDFSQFNDDMDSGFDEIYKLDTIMSRAIKLNYMDEYYNEILNTIN